jgi:hypothetical protein
VAQTTLAQALGLRLITIQEYQNLSAGITAKFADDLFKKDNDAWRQRLIHLQGQYRTENEQTELKYAEELTIINNALANEQITQQEHDRLLERIELEHQARLGDISAQGAIARTKFMEMTAIQQTQTVLQQMLQMTQGVATHNRALFNLNKAVSIANAIMNTYVGANKVLAQFGWWGIPLAAVMIAVGLANVAQIAAAKLDSSTSAPSIAGGTAIPVTAISANTPTPALSPVLPTPAPQRPQINLTLVGEFFDFKTMVDKVIPLLNEAIANGADIHVTT